VIGRDSLLTGLLFNIIILSAYFPTGDEGDKENSICEDLERVLDQIRKQHMNILLGHVNGKAGSTKVVEGVELE
jgi:hypothetical protein